MPPPLDHKPSAKASAASYSTKLAQIDIRQADAVSVSIPVVRDTQTELNSQLYFETN
jgi:hypothetical protein